MDNGKTKVNKNTILIIISISVLVIAIVFLIIAAINLSKDNDKNKFDKNKVIASANSSNKESSSHDAVSNDIIASYESLTEADKGSSSVPDTQETGLNDSSDIIQNNSSDSRADDNKVSRPEKVTQVYSYKNRFSMPIPKKDTFFDSENGNTLKYCLFLPDDYSPTKKYPLILFLHGAGELGTDNVSQLNNIKNMFACNGDYISNAILLCPQTAEWWNLDRESYGDQRGTLGSALHLLNKIQQDYSCDKNRIYVTGLSMGGYATWEILEHYGDIFAAGVPLCGFGNTENGAAFKDIPIRIYHGTADPTVSFSSSQRMYNSIVAAGGQMVELFPLLDVKHDAWNYAYADRDLFAWLFAQNKEADSNTAYEVTPCFRVVDSNGKTVISDSDIYVVDYYLNYSDDSNSADVKIWLNQEGLSKLKKAYSDGIGEEFTVYYLTQKLYSFTATKPPIDDLFLITGVFDIDNYGDFYNAINVVVSQK